MESGPQMAGLSTVPTVVRDLNNNETAKIALIENLQREDLNAMDQARACNAFKKNLIYLKNLLARPWASQDHQ